ncbi:MAG: response regulator [Acidobacteriota bacterium]
MTKILLADDVKLYLALEKTFLARGQYEILTATNGPDALGLLRTERPDLSIVATGLPGLGALEIRDALLADPELAALPMIATTAAEEADGDLERRAEARGIAAVLVKPFAMNDLMGAVQKVLPAPDRRYPRYEAYVELELRTERSTAYMSGAALNVSLGGMLIETRACRRAWPSSISATVPIPRHARLMWPRARSEQRRESPGLLGVEFKSVPPDARASASLPRRAPQRDGPRAGEGDAGDTRRCIVSCARGRSWPPAANVAILAASPPVPSTCFARGLAATASAILAVRRIRGPIYALHGATWNSATAIVDSRSRRGRDG